MNQVAMIDVDIIVDQAPDYASLRAEQFQMLGELAQSGVPIPPQAIIEASDLRDKDKILQAMQPPPEAQQMQQRSAMLDMAGKEAKVERDKAAAAKDMATIPVERAQAIKTMADAQATTIQARRTAMGF